MKISNDIKGFTLIEVIVAIGILSIVLMSVYGTFFSVSNAVETSDGVMYRMREVRVFFDMVKREIESAYVESDRDDTLFRVRDRDVFGLYASELGFTAFVPYGRGLHFIEYSVDKENMVLKKKVAAAWGEDTLEEVTVLEDIKGFRVEVRGADRWLGTYNDKKSIGLPMAVKVTLTLNVNGVDHNIEQTFIPKIRG
ncbi:MAG: prepilin-type N-terminal cleavage/methylation domain-containing protein [Nitrospirota bacterium]|nr:MAG: prepilin-type N-terminal cleavage/methylation domain-containing protein [Nitrospirota bacterium]